MNQVTLKGRLGVDAQLHEPSGDGKPFISLSLAVSERYFDKENKSWKQTDTQWFRCVSWLPSIIKEAKYLTRGAYVNIVGKLQQHEYTNDQGVKHVVMDIHMTHLEEIIRREKSSEPASDIH